MKNKLFAILLLSVPLILSSATPQIPIKTAAETTPQYIIDYNNGLDAQNKRNWTKAIEFYEKSVNERSDFAPAFNNLGYCYRRLAETYLDKAGKAYKKALNLDPNHAKALEYQGEYYLMRGQFRQAYDNYQKLKELDPKEAQELKKSIDKILKESQDALSKTN